MSIAELAQIESLLHKEILAAMERAELECKLQSKLGRNSAEKHWRGIVRGYAEATLIVSDVFADLQNGEAE